jgi:hypothetical protein
MTAFRFVRDLLIIAACLCVILLTVNVIYLESRVGAAVNQIEQQIGGAPTDQPTGCPFGPGQCEG